MDKPPILAASLFAVLVCLVAAFEAALALGAPWGRFAMGGAFPGVLPSGARAAAVVQAGILLAAALVVVSRAGLELPAWRDAARWLIWPIVVLLAVSAVLNLITPSPLERAIWAPVAAVLFATALRVALFRS